MSQPNGVASDGAGVDPAPSKDSPPSQPQRTSTSTTLPATSVGDNGLSKRPRDARLIHMILANLGVTAYQERVPLQLMDFAYRYTSSTLQDALHLSSEGYGSTTTAAATSSTAGRGAGASTAPNANNNNNNNNNDMSSVTLPALRLAIASRLNYQFSPSLPKEFLQEMAQERNRVALPSVGREWGVRLPPERYCLTGVGWGLKEEWDSDGEDEEEADENAGGEKMEESWEGQVEGGEEDADQRMEDVFGEQDGGLEGVGESGLA